MWSVFQDGNLLQFLSREECDLASGVQSYLARQMWGQNNGTLAFSRYITNVYQPDPRGFRDYDESNAFLMVAPHQRWQTQKTCLFVIAHEYFKHFLIVRFASVASLCIFKAWKNFCLCFRDVQPIRIERLRRIIAEMDIWLLIRKFCFRNEAFTSART